MKNIVLGRRGPPRRAAGPGAPPFLRRGPWGAPRTAAGPGERSKRSTFAEACQRLLHFAQNVVEMALADDSDSSSGEMIAVPALKEKPPAVIVAAHNAWHFDIPILFVEMLRCGMGLEPFEPWYFVDTLHVLRAADADLTGGCVKLQCLLTRLRASDGGLQAHRALDC